MSEAVGPFAGRLVRLEPIAPAHVDGLVDAAVADRTTFGHTTVPDRRDWMRAYVDEMIAARAIGDAYGFAQVRVADGVVVGATRFLTVRRRRPGADPYAVEIGGTWLAASAQRTGINVEAKLLLLTYAFEQWHVGRVDFKTDARNERSRTAIAALGARFEGVLRGWQPSHVAGEEDGLRDSAMFSIVAAEWPAVHDGLRARLG